MEPVVTVTSSLEELQTEVSKELLRGVSLDPCFTATNAELIWI